MLALCGAAIGVAGLTASIVLTRGRTGDALLLIAIAAMAVPLDKYFAFRDHVGGWPGVRVSAADAALFALLPIAAVGVLTGRVRNAIPRAVGVVYALLLLQYGLSVANASERDLAMFEMMSAVHALAVAVVVGMMFRRELFRPFVALVALHVVVHTVFAVAQVATGRPVGAAWFTTATIVSEALETGVVRLRPVGLFDHPIIYANVLMLSLPVLFAGLLIAGNRLWKIAMAAALVIGSIGLGLTLSRGAWFSTALAAACLLALLRARGLMNRVHVARIVVARRTGGGDHRRATGAADLGAVDRQRRRQPQRAIRAELDRGVDDRSASFRWRRSEQLHPGDGALRPDQRDAPLSRHGS